MSVAVAGSSDRAILALKHWCNAALDVDRQWKHLVAVDVHGDIPPEALVEAKMIPADAKPAHPILPDNGSGGCGGGNEPVQNRGRRGRGRGRGRGRRAAAVAEASPSEAAAAQDSTSEAPEAATSKSSGSSESSGSSDASDTSD